MRHANIAISVFWGVILNLAEQNGICAQLQPPLFHLAGLCFCLLLYQSSKVNSRCFCFYIGVCRWESKAVSDCHCGSLQFFDVHSLWVQCAWSPHLSCLMKYWWKAVIINGLKYWVNYMVGLPAVEWFTPCHAGQLQKHSVIWPRCEEFPNEFVQILSIPVLSLCVVLW